MFTSPMQNCFKLVLFATFMFFFISKEISNDQIIFSNFISEHYKAIQDCQRQITEVYK